MAWRDDDVCHLLWFQCLQSMFVSTFANIRWCWILRRSSFVPVRMRLYPFCRWKIKFSSKARSCNTPTECISKSLRTESKKLEVKFENLSAYEFPLSDTTTYHSCHQKSPGGSPCRSGHFQNIYLTPSLELCWSISAPRPLLQRCFLHRVFANNPPKEIACFQWLVVSIV